MIPILGITSPAGGAGSAVSTPAESGQAAEKAGLFGALLQSESTPQTANATPPVVEIESGNLLPDGGNLLPVLGVQDISLSIGEVTAELAADASDPGASAAGLLSGSPGGYGDADSSILPGLVAPAQASLLLGAGEGNSAKGVTTSLLAGETPPAAAILSGSASPKVVSADGSLPTGLAAGDLATQEPPGLLTRTPGAVPLSTEAAASAPPLTAAASTTTAEAAQVAGSSSRLAEALTQNAPRTASAPSTPVSSISTPGQRETASLLQNMDGQRQNFQQLVVSDVVTLEPLQTWGGTDAGSARASATATQVQPVLGLSQPASIESLQTVRAPVLAPLSAPPGEPEFTPEVVNRVAVMLKNGSQEASLQLNPPELGRLEIRIVTEGDQARVQFAVHNPDARDAIEQSLPRLRDMLEQSGLQLARGDVADHSRGGQQSDATPSSSSVGVDDDSETVELTSHNIAVDGVLQPGVDYYV